jgi:hypothetical protein
VKLGENKNSPSPRNLSNHPTKSACSAFAFLRLRICRSGVRFTPGALSFFLEIHGSLLKFPLLHM